jgi:hypothetical protein
MKPREQIGVALMIASLLGALVGVWCWALFGMSDEVGVASGVTCLIIGGIGFLSWLD